MRQQTRASKEPAEKVVQDIRRATRKHYSAEEKIRIVLEGLRGEDSIAELCRREGIAQNLLSLPKMLSARLGNMRGNWRILGRDVCPDSSVHCSHLQPIQVAAPA
jgi:hypothetical protein